MDVAGEKRGTVLVVGVNGRLDAVTAPDFERRLAALLERGETRVVLDLTDLDYLSSAGLRAILGVGRKLAAAKGGLAIACLSGMIQDVFSISGFDGLFPVGMTVEEAADLL